MRFYFPNLSRPKRAAKAIAAAVDGLSLSKARAGLAIAYGYKDWHELEKSHAAAAPTPLDQAMPELQVPVRIADLAIRLADALDLYWGDAAFLLATSHATGDLPLDDWLSRSISDSLDGSEVVGRAERGHFRAFTIAELKKSTRDHPPLERGEEPNRLKARGSAKVWNA